MGEAAGPVGGDRITRLTLGAHKINTYAEGALQHSQKPGRDKQRDVRDGAGGWTLPANRATRQEAGAGRVAINLQGGIMVAAGWIGRMSVWVAGPNV